MKKKLSLTLCLVAALTACETPLRSASAYEWQCGQHYVETPMFGGAQIIGTITFNRTRDNHDEGAPKVEEVILNTQRPGGHSSPGFRMKDGKLYYRVEYKEPAE